MRRQIVAAAFVLLASISNAWADITYNLVDYPASQIIDGGGECHVSGTITTDGTLGVYTNGTSHLLGASFSIKTSDGDSYSVPVAAPGNLGAPPPPLQFLFQFTATVAALTIADGQNLSLIGPSPTPGGFSRLGLD